MNRKELVLDAARSVLKLRRSKHVPITDAVCPYDLAHSLGVEVRFVGDAPSLEGMYSAGNRPTIVVSSLRPVGRRAFNCVHELGHHIYGHGTRVDEVIATAGVKRPFRPEEFLADCFAGFLLMPKAAIEQAFPSRGYTTASPKQTHIYEVASYFGFGYATLIHHMRSNLEVRPKSPV